ncbi:hypothetical protein [Pseudobutyrivibrio xylanivorans]|uniref:VCBS repeat-containing protein n=1 Tax=Pseudobutyrivibrio xylanivorans DSM 14809 TaxID=1123012 RepID=A0A1M6G8T7_PSEXY|nr:hypothetical protein [Pseudobutyrivibrio xylanivorans]SHJ06322.1 hypothetical protein SAMN02745725_01675 [Pseudobutyrivibrio xylanivorans DSM 14809]
MVINNAEVSMASTTSYTSGMRLTVQSETKPVFDLKEITLLGDGLQAEETEKEEKTEAVDNAIELKPSSEYTLRLRTIEYLLKMFMLGRYFDEDSAFGQMLRETFGSMDELGDMSSTDNGALFFQTTTVSYEHWESQSVEYSSTGTAITADGRKLSFNYSFALSESFTEKYENVYAAVRNCVDPLVINLDDCPTSIADQTFFFDLDGDGEEDEIHNLGKGSGFLALDKDDDGFIKNGLELFGARTGDGFGELEEYDSDKNGWIDENDPVFTKLRIMTINEKGEQELFGLKESDVGAIYLGRLDTQFIHRSDNYDANAVTRKSGMFLHESDGHASGVQHVDFMT